MFQLWDQSDVKSTRRSLFMEFKEVFVTYIKKPPVCFYTIETCILLLSNAHRKYSINSINKHYQRQCY